MNLKGSYRALLKNSKAAMMAAIEIYNKPQIAYRDECFSILLINAWELLAKAILSKNGQRIYYEKKRGQPYKTYSLTDAFRRSKPYFPNDISYEPVAENVKVIANYRDNCIHFYNHPNFGELIYGLAQTNIHNYSDLLSRLFAVSIASEMTITLLPLGFGTEPDPIRFLQKAKANPSRNKQVEGFLEEIRQVTKNLEEQNLDTVRFLAQFNVSFQSVKKINSADIVVGIDADADDVTVVHRDRDPNVTHPLSQSEILGAIGDELQGVRFTQFTFQAIIRKYDIKNNNRYHWRHLSGSVSRYSRELVAYLMRLTTAELEDALTEYRGYLRSRRQQRNL